MPNKLLGDLMNQMSAEDITFGPTIDLDETQVSSEQKPLERQDYMLDFEQSLKDFKKREKKAISKNVVDLE